MDAHTEPVVSPIDEGTRERLRLRLDEERQRLLDAIRKVSRPADIPDRDDPGDGADLANRFSDPEVENDLHAQYEQRLRLVEAALARMEAGTYGVNLRTREAIPVDRLEAVPWATD
jgi:RNA polymerase-binding transcription factor DksA